MLQQLTVKNFAGVPYLETSQLMQTHQGKLKFSLKRPNVIVGPNGSGKSALLTALALRFLAFYTGQSTMDPKFVTSTESKAWWSSTSSWSNEYTFLQGLDCKTDNAAALYYRPGHIPGNETSIVHAIMTGYDKLAREYADKVEDKSSGQGNLAVLAKIVEVLQGADAPREYLGKKNWRFGSEPVTREMFRTRGFVGSYDYQAEVLKALLQPAADALPLVLMDEPEQSLDARAEAKLWSDIACADCSKQQVIVATHSLYPLMHPGKFNLIESEEGFIQDVLDLMGR